MSGFDQTLDSIDVGLLIVSGFLGVFLSDTLRYASLSRIGPSLQSLLNTMTVPFALVLGFVLLDQHVGAQTLVGTAIILAGLVASALARSMVSPTRFSGDAEGAAGGIVLGLASATSQALSVLVAAPVMLRGADPITATFVRSAAGTACLLIPVIVSPGNRIPLRLVNLAVARQIFLSAAIGTGLGMTLQLYALGSGPVGVVSTLTATAPLFVLPLVWVLGKSRPGLLAWSGALVSVIGVGLILWQR